MTDFIENIAAAELLAAIGGTIHKFDEVVDVQPVLRGDGSHEIGALRVVTTRTRAALRIIVKPEPVKLFVLHPGRVRSVNDWQVHRVSATALAQLYGVLIDECIVDDPDHPEKIQGYDKDYLDKLMHLHVRVADYRPVSAREREMVRERLDA